MIVRLAPLWAMIVLNAAALFVGYWLGVALSCTAVVVSFVWLVYLLNKYEFPWPWRHR